MGLQHDNPNALPQDALRTQRLTADESRAVIARWQQKRVEQTGLTDRPALPDVAEGLDIPVEEAQRLLAEVRAQRLEEERALVKEQARMCLAEEKRALAEVRRRRVRMRAEPAHRQRQAVRNPRWVQVRPGVWEDAQVPPPAEWTGDEEFWKETEQDKVARAAYRANTAKRTFTYALYGVLLLLVMCLGSLVLPFLIHLLMLNTR